MAVAVAMGVDCRQPDSKVQVSTYLMVCLGALSRGKRLRLPLSLLSKIPPGEARQEREVGKLVVGERTIALLAQVGACQEATRPLTSLNS